jgi:serine/threonine-protein kinase RsbW
MEIKLTLAMPRDELSVPVARRLLITAMSTLGVTDDIVDDIGLALTEACTNVIDHAAEGDEYEVSAGIDGDCVVIEVADRGVGFDGHLRGHAEAHHHDEDGRGIQLMRALVDRLSFVKHADDGSVVRLEKDLAWSAGSPLEQWSEQTAGDHGPWSAQRAHQPETTPH